ncbi:hypothetical protein AB1E18_012406 [Capra hircus]
MFITVMFGAGCWELVNTWCGLGTLTAHLRQRGQVPPDATIALLAEDGHLVSLAEGLEEGPSPAPSVASPPLRERGTYVLVQTIKGEGGDPTCYESLLENLDGQRPELAGECHSHGRGFPGLTEELRWRLGLLPEGDGQRRRLGTRRGHQEQGPPSRPLLSRTQELGPGAREIASARGARSPTEREATETKRVEGRRSLRGGGTLLQGLQLAGVRRP